MPKKKVSSKSKGKSSKKKNKSKEKSNNAKDSKPKRAKIIREKKGILIHQNPFQANEGLVKSIIDKLITISVRKSYSNYISRRLQNYYFEYLKNQVNILFATNNIYYWDEPELEHSQKRDKFWKVDLEKNNTWVEVSEPNTTKIDRYENAFMNFVGYSPTFEENASVVPPIKRQNTYNDIFNDKEGFSPYGKKISVNIKHAQTKEINKAVLDILEEKSSLSSLEEEDNENRSKNKNNKKNNQKNKLNNKNNSKISPKIENRNNNSSILTNKIKIQNKNNNNTNIISRKPKKEPIPEMKYKEIPGIEKEYIHDKYDPPNINILRKEREEEIIKKEKEEKKNLNIKKIMEIVKNANNENNNNSKKKIKLFDSNKLTFDSNGKILSFKQISIESLMNDFATLKDSIKSFDANIKLKKIKKKNTKNISQTRDDDKAHINIKEKIVKNPEDDPNGINRYNYVKLNLDKNEQIIPSGSNFSIMLPNIGVILKENEQIKEGNRDFGKYFKKYSKEDYDKILNDYVPLQNRTMLKNKINESTGGMNRTMTKKISKKILNISNNSIKMSANNNLLGNNLLLSTRTQNSSQINNIFNNIDSSDPLINHDNTIQGNDSFNNTNNRNINFNISKDNKYNTLNNSSLLRTLKSYKHQSYNNSFLNSNYINANKTRNGSYDTLQGFIKLNKNASSLKNELDSLKDLDEKTDLNLYPKPKKIDIRHKNIFESNYRDFRRLKNKDNQAKNNLNEFNKKIISNQGWGNRTISKNMSTGNLLYSKHHTRYQALRELGSNLLNGIKVKLPRDRKVDVKI